jgi:GTP-binding protein
MFSMRYLLSAPTISGLPEDVGAEVAFWGRSNAGKSTLLNVLSGQKKLARVSKRPGCTRMMNIFSLAEDVRLVDFPGYGYARASKVEQARWLDCMIHYIDCRQSLRGIVLIMDVRHPFQSNDMAVLAHLLEAELPICLVLNKIDQLKTNALVKQRTKFKDHPVFSSPNVQVCWLSAFKKKNVDELASILSGWLDE